MKLNTKRTVLVGLAFFLISAFWQMYDSIIPLLLTNKFGMSQTWSGAIMALDNVLAVFMLPLFGALSDKCFGNRYGKRKPFVAIGTIVAVIALVGLTFVDSAQLKNIEQISKVDDPAALTVIYDTQAEKELLTPEGEKFVLSEKFTKEEFVEIRTTSEDFVASEGETIKGYNYTNYVSPARQAYAADATDESPTMLIVFIGLLLIVLVSMATFRSPAVALMPDVTVKPLRSKANAIINLMGTAGGILVLVLGMVFATSSPKNALMSYTTFCCVVAAVMIGALVIFLLTVREKAWSKQMQEDSVRLGIEEKEADNTNKGKKLSKAEFRSLIFILLSIALWYFGYNAITSKYAVYAGNILQKDYNTTLLIAQAAAIVSYLPAGMIASKIGRKKTILAGVALLAIAFGSASVMRANSPTWLMNVLFSMAGIAWASINVNSFPMVVEMCSGGDIGKYTGFYYTASMSAQIATPVLSGFLMDNMGMTVLFPYAGLFVAGSFVTMCFVKHGDNKVASKKGLDAFDVED